MALTLPGTLQTTGRVRLLVRPDNITGCLPSDRSPVRDPSGTRPVVDRTLLTAIAGGHTILARQDSPAPGRLTQGRRANERPHQRSRRTTRITPTTSCRQTSNCVKRRFPSVVGKRTPESVDAENMTSAGGTARRFVGRPVETRALE